MRTVRNGIVVNTLFVGLLLIHWHICPANSSEPVPAKNNTFVIEWNRLAYHIAYTHDSFYSLIGVRALTMTHLAMHDALNSIDRRFEGYAFFESHPNADPVAAASQAAYEVLAEVYPDQVDTISFVLNKWLGKVKNKEAKQKGITLGKLSGRAILEKRASDGHQKGGDYTPMSKPGDYQYTPGWGTWVLKPDFDYATPFAMDSVTQFRSPPPPPLNSQAYAESYNEVKAYGCKHSVARTVDQTHFAHWWAEFAEHSWNRIGRIAALKYKLDPWETARLFALINMDIYDIYLASLESKYHYDTWRPFTAIRGADRDGNPETMTDTNWVPEMLTPPWPEYPSAHASVGSGGAEVVSEVLGTADMTFTMQSVTAIPGAEERTYHNLWEAADECAESRIMNGYHFRFATEEGKRQGVQVARYILANFLRPVQD